MTGRDSEFQKKLQERQRLALAQAKILGEEPEILPDPRTNIPFSATEITFRQCYHTFERMVIQGTPEGDLVVYKMSIIDPHHSKVYHYQFRDEVLLAMISDLTAMRDHVDAPDAPDAPAS